MRWGSAYFVALGLAVALLVAGLLLAGGFGLRKRVVRFGDEERIRAMYTFNSARRRGYKGILLVAAVLFAFVAAAQPQFGEGKRLIPRTNLDVVLVLDFSKSMYARDVKPSRTFRAKVEIERLIKLLRGARFGAVAFAGEPMGFPLTADGAAIAQFLRQLNPNSMPVGGTAIGRALRQARNLLARDPKSRKHKRVIVLVTDGEDLEGNPVAVAKDIGSEGTQIHVVQIGGRTPEPIPEVDKQGEVLGWRTSPTGKPMLTSLSQEGEKQLEDIAKEGKGQLVRAAKGTTGIDAIAQKLRHDMVHKLSEKVENVYAEVYFYPLAAAVLLLLLELLMSEAPRRKIQRKSPPPKKPRLTRRPTAANRREGLDGA
jgi:Ca-activated chloride channel homolog